MMAWVTDSPNWANTRVTSLDYRFLSAMQGGLGIGANLLKWQAEDFATARTWIAAYKTIRPTVQRGRLYRLVSPDASASTSATLYVARDQRQAVLFQMLHSSTWRDNPGAILPLGLAAERRYAIRLLGGGALPAGIPAVASGLYWMTQGVRAPLKGDFVGAAFVFEATP